MILPAFMFSLLFLQFYPHPQNIPAVPASEPDSKYPLHVQLQVMSSGGYGSLGNGRGNILGSPPAGFDFVENCDQNFSQNRDPNQVYQARWRKQDLRLEILLKEIGSTHVSRCELQTTLHGVPYDLYPTRFFNNSAPAPAPTAPPLILALPAATPVPEYPLRVELWLTRYGNPTDSHPSGLGNIRHHPKIGFEYVNDHCDPRLSFSRDPDVLYQARWKEQDRTLEVLLQEIGSTRTYGCVLTVAVGTKPNNLHFPPKAVLDPPVPGPVPVAVPAK